MRRRCWNAPRNPRSRLRVMRGVVTKLAVLNVEQICSGSREAYVEVSAGAVERQIVSRSCRLDDVVEARELARR